MKQKRMNFSVWKRKKKWKVTLINRILINYCNSLLHLIDAEATLLKKNIELLIKEKQALITTKGTIIIY